MIEARNLRALTQTQSSLLGGENTPLHEAEGTGFNAQPRRDLISTPNPLATPLRTANGTGAARPGATPLRTPRDSLSLNPDYSVNEEELAMQKLRMGFANLPKPKNDFELVLPDESEDEEMVEEQLTFEDSEDRDKALRLAQESEQLAALNRRSQVLQKNLPRPKRLNVDSLLSDAKTMSDPVQRLVVEEMVRLMLFDAARYPLPDTDAPAAPSDFVEYSAEDLAKARAEIARESEPIAYESEVWESDNDVYLKTIPSSVVKAKLVDSAPAGNKLEKKLSLTLGGYSKRQDILAAKIKEVTAALEQSRSDLEIYRALQVAEEISGPLRTAVRSLNWCILTDHLVFA